MIKSLAIKLFRQNPKYAFCSLNALRSILTFYNIPNSRESLLKHLKTHKLRGTDIADILDTLTHYNVKYSEKTLSWKALKRHIDSSNPIMISYKSDINESHSSIICGYTVTDGVEIVKLCDSLFGFYFIPLSLLRVLINSDSGTTNALFLIKITV